MNVRIDQLEPELAQKLVSPLRNILHELRYTIPGQYQLRVSLLDANGRKKRSDASADNWSPESGRIEIRFEPAPEERKIASPEVSRGEDRKSSSDSLANRLLRALDRAESTPGWNFVSLKKFRDEILPSEPFSPGAFQPADVHWQDAIRSAIEKRLILVGKVPNPKSPQFPVTSIRLNRLMPEVQEVLGLPKRDLDFHPIHIKGEPLSATILRERR
ncbi:MAG: hypothetical protein WBQ74_13215 [Candidatus Sulfotelmatobacter sp.]|jgi:hypothetical protein